MARTRAADFEEKQRGILMTAARVFAEMGMEKASMAQIAQASGVSKSLLYHYYKGKDALLFDIVRTHLEELDAAIEAVEDATLPPHDRLRVMICAVLETYRDADDQHKVQLNGTTALSDEQNGELRRLERKIVHRFSTVIDDITPGLNANKPLLMPATMSLFGMMNWVYMWFRDGGPIDRAEYADLAATLFLEGIKAVRS